METTLDDIALNDLLAPFGAPTPARRQARQPLHTVYGPADKFRADTAARLSRRASDMFATYAGDAEALKAVFALDGALDASDLHRRVEIRLAGQAVEDYRLDFEDGYGVRPDAHEDADAVAAATEVVLGLRRGGLPRGLGVRLKCLDASSGRRALRTLDLFLTTLLEAGVGLPERFVITLPKVEDVAAPGVLQAALERIEKRFGLQAGALGIELMVESPQALVHAESGALHLPALVAACAGRCQGVHFGAYDYTAQCGVASSWQHLRHPSCDLARQLMQMCLAQDHVAIWDGATHRLPVGPHRASPNGLSAQQEADNRGAITTGWQMHYLNVQHALRAGIYAGWDLHPGQLVSRYVAHLAFFAAGMPESLQRLRTLAHAQAARTGSVFDDAASTQGLLNFFSRALACGAVDAVTVQAAGWRQDSAGHLVPIL